MASAVLGKVSPTPKGEYVSTQDYARLDVVTYEGYPYLAKSNVPSGNLPTDELYWMPLLTGLDFAPGGYGLGVVTPKDVGAPDNALETGEYVVDDPYGGKGWIWCDSSNAYYKHQTLFNISAGSSDGNRLSKKRERWMYAGIWQPWEWVNPPMQVGVEYRTTERWQGNVVYTMMVDCGAAANGKTTTPNIGNGTIFKFVGRTVGYALPMLHTGLSSTYMMYLYCDNDSVTIMCGSAMVGKQTYCQIWYYKD